MKKTDMVAVKQIAYNFLLLEPKPDGDYPFVVHHPFISAPYSLIDGEMVDVIHKTKNYAKVFNRLQKQIEEANSACDILELVQIQYALVLFKFIQGYLSKEDYGQVLKRAYKLTETPSINPNFSMSEIKGWFLQAEKRALMSENEWDFYEELPETIEVFRGLQDHNSGMTSISWTSDPTVAYRFKNMYGTEGGAVYKAKIRKKDIFAYWEEESEIVVDYDKLFELKRVDHGDVE